MERLRLVQESAMAADAHGQPGISPKARQHHEGPIHHHRILVWLVRMAKVQQEESAVEMGFPHGDIEYCGVSLGGGVKRGREDPAPS
jgi:hypothetical protein